MIQLLIWGVITIAVSALGFYDVLHPVCCYPVEFCRWWHKPVGCIVPGLCAAFGLGFIYFAVA